MPSRPWGTVWLTAILAAAVLIGGWEAFWRDQGLAPSVRDTGELWALARDRASSGRADTVVFVGSSVTQAAIDQKLFSELVGVPPPVQLGLTGATGLSVLENLAEDDAFIGTAIVEHPGATLAQIDPLPERLARAALRLHSRREASPFQRSELFLELLVDGHAVYRLSELSPGRLVRRLRAGEWPGRRRLTVDTDRTITFDFGSDPRLAPGAAALNRRWHEHSSLTDDERAVLSMNLARIDAAVETIRGRGGEVFFVLYRCEGLGSDLTERRRATFWTELTSNTTAHTIDVDDHVPRGRLRCPDGAHLDRASRSRLTKALGSLVAASR